MNLRKACNPTLKKARGEAVSVRRSKLPISGLVLFLIGAPFAAQAQSVQTSQAELARETQPSFTPTPAPGAVEAGQAVASPNDTDLGEQRILKRTAEYQPFTFTVNTPFFYTSNVALTNTRELSDFVVAPAVAAFYQPRFTPTLYGLVDVRQQFFHYAKHDEFDFGTMDVEAGLSYFLPQLHNLVLRGEYDFNRLTSLDSDFDEFFENHSIILNAELPVRISRAQQLAFGADANISVAADHQGPRRNDYEEYASYSLQLTRALLIAASGRLALRDYHAGGRRDTSEIVSLNATYSVTKWWTISAISSYAHNESNQDVFSYNVGNLGGAVSLAVKF